MMVHMQKIDRGRLLLQADLPSHRASLTSIPDLSRVKGNIYNDMVCSRFLFLLLTANTSFAKPFGPGGTTDRGSLMIAVSLRMMRNSSGPVKFPRALVVAAHTYRTADTLAVWPGIGVEPLTDLIG